MQTACLRIGLRVPESERVVLVVEDDETIRNVIADVLEDRGFRVQGAANGVEALVRLDEARPDVMVLDLLMPVMHGWDFMESYAQKTGGDQIPIVVVSVNPALPRSFNRFGVHAVIGKPFDVDELLNAVDEALSTTNSEAVR
jgi:two-component system, chemotaxis family, chemotaxis protein CheY